MPPKQANAAAKRSPRAPAKPAASPASDVSLTHPDKVLFPADGITKADLAAYYERAAPLILPQIRGRPLTMDRYPDGIEEKGFFHKDMPKGAPDWLARVEVPKKGGTVTHPLIQDARSLRWMANQNCVTPHVWTSRVANLNQPDLCVFDLDPSKEEPKVLLLAVLAVGALLREIGLPSWVKTTGSKGFHIVVPLDGKASFDEVFNFAESVGRILVQRAPEHLTMEFKKADRGGRIFVDVGRNGYSATFAAPYAVRPRPGAPVSAPCTWEEIQNGSVGPATFTLKTMAKRLDKVGDLWADLSKHRFSLKSRLSLLERRASR